MFNFQDNYGRHGGFVHNNDTKAMPKEYLKDAKDIYIVIPDTLHLKQLYPERQTVLTVQSCVANKEIISFQEYFCLL